MSLGHIQNEAIIPARKECLDASGGGGFKGSLKIAHVTFNMAIGGAERVIEHLVSATDKTKYEVSIICLEQPIGVLGQRLRQSGVQVTGFNRQPGFDRQLIRQMRQHIRRDEIDILHCHQYSPYIYGLFSGLGTKTKVIFTEHGRFYPDRWSLKRVLINPLLSRLTAAVTAISQATAQALVDYENIPGHNIKVIYNGISLNGKHSEDEQTNRFQIPPNAFVLGTVARLDPIKNHALMILAVAELIMKYPHLHLLIVGDGPERQNLENLIAKHRLENHVTMTGWVERPSGVYNIMDVFLLTSFSEGTAMTLLEAMSASLPCIVTDVGGNPEIVENGKTGFVIPNDDQIALRDRIEQFVNDQQLGKQMGLSGRQCFEERFTVSLMTRNYERLYDTVAA